MEDAPPQPMFLDVPTLLETSQPRPRVPWFWFIAGACLVLVVLGALSGAGSSVALQVGSWLLLTGLFLGMPLLLRHVVGQVRAEQHAIEGASELVQLRQYAQAGILLQQILSQPSRTHPLRSQALIYLAAVLSRYHRFEEAISIQNHLIDHNLVDPGTAYGLKLGRAMAMLREDHLFDADRAISDLRRSGPSYSAGTALIEIYRDVKTGHPADAVRVFEDKLLLLRDQLGHRLADAYALAARAYDLLGQGPQAADAFRRATLLSPLPELCRRYAEVEKLVGRYQPAPAPPELA